MLRGALAVQSSEGAKWNFTSVPRNADALGLGFWPGIVDLEGATTRATAGDKSSESSIGGAAKKRLLLVRFPRLDGASPRDLTQKFGAPAWVAEEVYATLRWCGAERSKGIFVTKSTVLSMSSDDCYGRGTIASERA